VAKITGRVFIKIDGKIQRSKEGAKINLGGVERTSISGTEVYGYAEKPKPSSCEFTLIHAADTDLPALNALTDATIEFETDTGKRYAILGAWLTEPPELTAGGGEVSMKFEGPPAVEK
jgi:hypothetical protein